MKNLFWLAVMLFYGSNLQAQDFVWGKSIHGTAGSSSVNLGALVKDGNGHVYTIALFDGTADFDPSPNIYPLTCIGTTNKCVLKFDTDGGLIWVKQFTSSLGYMEISGIIVNDTGTVYLTGFFTGTIDFDPNAGVQNLTAQGIAKDIFILSLDSAGNFLWVKQITGDNDQEGATITLDENNNIYITGNFEDTIDFDPGIGISTMMSNAPNETDIYILKLDAQGNFNWVKSYGEAGNDQMLTNIVFNSGNLYVPMALSDGQRLVKLDAGGNEIWLKQWSQGPSARYIVVINSNIYISGVFGITSDFDPGPATYSLPTFGLGDIFVMKLDDSGNFQWVKQIGGTEYDSGGKLLVTNNNTLLLSCGSLGACDFDPGPQQYILTATPNTNFNGDIFLLALSEAGNFINVLQFGNAEQEYLGGIVLDDQENIILSGSFWDTLDVDPGSGIYNINTGISSVIGGFLIKLSNTLNVEEVRTINTSVAIYPNPTNGHLTISSSENINSISITDMLGRVLYQELESSKECNINIPELPAGLYNVIVRTVNSSSTYKIQVIA